MIFGNKLVPDLERPIYRKSGDVNPIEEMNIS